MPRCQTRSWVRTRKSLKPYLSNSATSCKFNRTHHCSRAWVCSGLSLFNAGVAACPPHSYPQTMYILYSNRYNPHLTSLIFILKYGAGRLVGVCLCVVCHGAPAVLCLYHQRRHRPDGINLHPTKRSPGCQSRPQNNGLPFFHYLLQRIVRVFKIANDSTDEVQTTESKQAWGRSVMFFSTYTRQM